MQEIAPDVAGAEAQPINEVWSDLTKMARLVLAQLRSAMVCFHTADLSQAEEIVERDDVVDNLNLMLEERCFNLVATGRLDAHQLRILRATTKVIVNLERASDAGTHIAKRVRLMQSDGIPQTDYDFGEVERLALVGLDEAIRAFLDRDLDLARQACLREPELDGHYVTTLKAMTQAMQDRPSDVPYLVNCLSVLKYLEKVADYTLNIGEQAIYLITGRRLKFSQFQQLDRLVGEADLDDRAFHPYWDGISGAVVARVDAPNAPVIFKEGSRRKIQAEAEKLEAWSRISKELTPRVLSSVGIADRQALLREFVDGTLFSDLYQGHAARELKLEATKRLLATLELVWNQTLKGEPPVVDYVAQIRSRLADIFDLHPELREVARAGVERGDSRVDLDQLLHLAREVEKTLVPPYSVWLHGDLNANNVVFDPATGQIKFVDVYRSRYGDLLQDVGVFLTSMDRRPSLTPEVRADLELVNAYVVDRAANFAREHGDQHFERRLQLSLARANLTSARVIVDDATADRLFRRGLVLLRDVVDGG